jgi:hypothetical protein
MQTEMYSPCSAIVSGDISAQIVGMLVKQILDLQETLSFYERELFAPEPELTSEEKPAEADKELTHNVEVPSIPLENRPVLA